MMVIVTLSVVFYLLMFLTFASMLSPHAMLLIISRFSIYLERHVDWPGLLTPPPQDGIWNWMQQPESEQTANTTSLWGSSWSPWAQNSSPSSGFASGNVLSTPDSTVRNCWHNIMVVIIYNTY